MQTSGSTDSHTNKRTKQDANAEHNYSTLITKCSTSGSDGVVNKVQDIAIRDAGEPHALHRRGGAARSSGGALSVLSREDPGAALAQYGGLAVLPGACR